MPEVVEKPEERSVEDLLDRFEESLKDIKNGNTSGITSESGSE